MSAILAWTLAHKLVTLTLMGVAYIVGVLLAVFMGNMIAAGEYRSPKKRGKRR